MTEALVHEPSDDNLANIVEEISQQLVVGNSDAIEAILAEHPHEADRLRALLPTLRVLVEIGSSPVGQNRSNATVAATYSQESLHPQLLGDFRILREIGRGGMGVVFEAEQVSLRRRVALKVLPTASMLDPRSLQRFRNEAQAAASLHHSHIVPIYGVGCERGVHYYAMQYIDGLTIAEVIAKLRESSKLALGPQAQPQPHAAESGSQAQLDSKDKQVAETEVMAALSTEKSSNSGAWFRRLAEHMAQVADALHHAHELGVTHRDIKPANLMLDRLGRIWVTDFGLARVEGADNLTMTGDLVGTLRYMSPEQALAKRLGVDHRSDIYSLGITLYELLTLTPAFAGEGRQELLQQLANQEPKSLREQNPAIPRDLETIVIKATQKNPSERYQTAAELAADLRRFVEDRHIVARRPSLPVRAMRLAKRHNGLASTVCVMLLLVTFGCLGWAYDYRQRVASTTRLVNEALEELAIRRATAVAKENDLVAWEKASSVAQRAKTLVERGPLHQKLEKNTFQKLEELEAAHQHAIERVSIIEKDARIVSSLDAARMELGASLSIDGWRPDIRKFISSCEEAFYEYGLDLYSMHEDKLVAQIQESAIQAELVAALLARAVIAPKEKRRNLLSIVNRCSTSSPGILTDLVDVLFDDTQARGSEHLKQIVSSEAFTTVPPEIAFCICLAIETADPQLAVSVTRNFVLQHPSDFFLNAFLGELLTVDVFTTDEMLREIDIASNLARTTEAIRYLSAAIALRPSAPKPHVTLGMALLGQGKLNEATTAVNKALKLRADYTIAHTTLGIIYEFQGNTEKAIQSHREAIVAGPDYPFSYLNLGVALVSQGKLEEAVDACQKCVRLDPRAGIAYYNLASTLRKQGKVDDAMAACREAIRLDPTCYKQYNLLGILLRSKGDVESLENAVRAYGESIRLNPQNANAHSNLGNALLDQGKLNDALASQLEAIRLKPRFSSAYVCLSGVYECQKRYDKAEDALREAVRLDPSFSNAWTDLGKVLVRQEKYQEAEAAGREAVCLDPASVEAYNLLSGALCYQSKFDESVATLQAAIRLEPNSASLITNLGDVFFRQRKVNDAINTHLVAIRIDPNCARAHQSLAQTLRFLRKLDEAETACLEAIRLAPDDPASHYELGLIFIGENKPLKAEEAFREAVRRDPYFAPAHRDLASILASLGKLDEAEAACREAIRLSPKDARGNYELGLILIHRKKFPQAVIAFREALRIKSDFPEALCSLGSTLRQLGNYPEALELMTKGHELGSRNPGWPYPSRQWLDEVEKLLKLSTDYKAILENCDLTLSASDRIGVANFALVNKQNPVISLRCYEKAFAVEPSLADDPRTGHRYNAACAALMTAAAKQKEVDQSKDADRVRLRHQALVWLQADVDAFKKLADNAAPGAVLPFINSLAHWEKDPDIESLRDEEQFKKLPAEDQELSKKLWSEHAELLKQSREKQSSVGK